MKLSHDTAVLSSCARGRVIHKACSVNRAILISSPYRKVHWLLLWSILRKVVAAGMLEWWRREGNSELVSGESKTSDVLVGLTKRRCKRQTDGGGCGWGSWSLPLWPEAGYFTSPSLGFPHLYSDSPRRMHLRGLGGLNGRYIPPFIEKFADSCCEVY